MKQKVIVIKKEFANDFITREAGEKLRHVIEDSFARKEQLELDFTGLTVASTSFFDEGIAKLKFSDWTKEQLGKYVHSKGLHPGDQKVLKTVCRLRGLD